MRENKIRRLPVVDKQDGVVGMISLSDLTQEAARKRFANVKAITDYETSETLDQRHFPCDRAQALTTLSSRIGYRVYRKFDLQTIMLWFIIKAANTLPMPSRSVKLAAAYG